VKNVATVVAAENTDVIWLKKVMYSYRHTFSTNDMHRWKIIFFC